MHFGANPCDIALAIFRRVACRPGFRDSQNTPRAACTGEHDVDQWTEEVPIGTKESHFRPTTLALKCDREGGAKHEHPNDKGRAECDFREGTRRSTCPPRHIICPCRWL